MTKVDIGCWYFALKTVRQAADTVKEYDYTSYLGHCIAQIKDLENIMRCDYGDLEPSELGCETEYDWAKSINKTIQHLRGRATICDAAGRENDTVQLRKIASLLDELLDVKCNTAEWRRKWEGRHMEPHKADKCKECVCVKCEETLCVFHACRLCLIGDEYKPVRGCPMVR